MLNPPPSPHCLLHQVLSLVCVFSSPLDWWQEGGKGQMNKGRENGLQRRKAVLLGAPPTLTGSAVAVLPCAIAWSLCPSLSHPWKFYPASRPPSSATSSMNLSLKHYRCCLPPSAPLLFPGPLSGHPLHALTITNISFDSRHSPGRGCNLFFRATDRTLGCHSSDLCAQDGSGSRWWSQDGKPGLLAPELRPFSTSP